LNPFGVHSASIVNALDTNLLRLGCRQQWKAAQYCLLRLGLPICGWMTAQLSPTSRALSRPITTSSVLLHSITTSSALLCSLVLSHHLGCHFAPTHAHSRRLAPSHHLQRPHTISSTLHTWTKEKDSQTPTSASCSTTIGRGKRSRSNESPKTSRAIGFYPSLVEVARSLVRWVLLPPSHYHSILFGSLTPRASCSCSRLASVRFRKLEICKRVLTSCRNLIIIRPILAIVLSKAWCPLLPLTQKKKKAPAPCLEGVYWLCRVQLTHN
jgi:hypothetical protein